MITEERKFELLQKRVDKLYDEILPNINNNIIQLTENQQSLNNRQASLEYMLNSFDNKLNTLSNQQRNQLSWKIIFVTLILVVVLYIIYRV